MRDLPRCVDLLVLLVFFSLDLDSFVGVRVCAFSPHPYHRRVLLLLLLLLLLILLLLLQ